MSEGSSNAREISLGDFVLVPRRALQQLHEAQSLNAAPPAVLNAILSLLGDAKPTPANDAATKPRTAPEIGAVESTGEHKGGIYGGIYPADNKPIWFSAAPRLMDHYNAAAWAKGQGGALPTREQGDYLDTLRDKGAFTEIFNRGSSFPAGYVWLAEPSTYSSHLAWCQRLSDGDEFDDARRIDVLPVLCCVR